MSNILESNHYLIDYGNYMQMTHLITQAELQSLLEAGDVAREFDRLRAKLIEKLDAGAEVENGPLRAFLELQTTKQLSWGGLQQYLSADEFRRLNETYKGKPRRFVRVTRFNQLVR